MNMNSLSLLLLVTTVALFIVVSPGRAAEPSVNLIFDTDMGGDCDDVGALFILHGAVERGEATLLATMGCVSADSIAPALDAINIWFGRPEIPVGTLKDPGLLAGPHYTSDIARRFPHKFPNGRDYPDAVALYRKLLAQQPDSSVVVLAVGPLRNLANLLKSGPDETSPMDGVVLVAKKVKRLDIMGGNYPPFANANEGEWNFKQDPVAASLVCSTWPTPVLFNGEGGSTMSGSVSMAEGRFTLTGCGYAMTGFWERRHDQGAYVSQAVPGDAAISARLTSLAPIVGDSSNQRNSGPSTASGFLLRESLTEGCGRYAAVEVESSGKLVFRWRDKVGPDESHEKELSQVTLPIHLKLTRTGRQIQVFCYADGQSWGEPLLTHTTTFDGQSHLGLYTCSGNTFASTTAIFETVKLSP